LDVCQTKDCPGVVMQNEYGVAFDSLHSSISLMAKEMPVMGMAVTEMCLANDLDNKTVTCVRDLALALIGIGLPDYKANNHQRASHSVSTPEMSSSSEPDLVELQPTPSKRGIGKFSSWVAATAAGLAIATGGFFAVRSRDSLKPNTVAQATDPLTPNVEGASLSSVDAGLKAGLEEKIRSLQHEVLVLRNPDGWDAQMVYTGIHSKSPFHPICEKNVYVTDPEVLDRYATLWSRNESVHHLNMLVSVCFAIELTTGEKPQDFLKTVLGEDERKRVVSEYQEQYFKLKGVEFEVRDYLRKWKLVPPEA
jgi:hypothetical protein